MQYAKMTEDRNKQISQEADNIFLERKGYDEKVKEKEDEIDRITQNLEQQLNNLDQRAHNQYLSLEKEKKNLIEMGNSKQNDINQINMRIYELDRRVKIDQNIGTYIEFEKELKKLDEEKATVDENLKIYSMDDSEAKAYLTNKAKSLKEKISDLEDEIDSVSDETKRIREDIENSKKGSDDKEMEKLEKIKSREDEMNKFISTFPELRQKESDEQQRLQETIVALLAHISNNISSKTNLPDSNAFKEMKDDLDFKQQQADNAEKTKEGLTV